MVHLAVPVPWLPMLTARQGKAPVGAASAGVGPPAGAAEHTAALCHGGASKLHSPVIKEKIFQRNFYFINFTYILKLILTTFVLLLASCLCCLDLVSIKFSEILITKQVQFTILTTTAKFLITKCSILALYLILCPCLA